MGGYAAFVWPSYALTLAVIVLNIVWARRALARARADARRRLARARSERHDTAPPRRLILVLGIVAGVGIAGALALQRLPRRTSRSSSTRRRSPPARCRPARRFRLGGMVTQGSVQRAPGSLEVQLRGHRFQPRRAGELHRRAAGPVPRGGRAWWRTGSCDATAPSWPTKCSPSTTRSTCRRRWRAR